MMGATAHREQQRASGPGGPALRDPVSVANEALSIFSGVTECLSNLRSMQVSMGKDLDSYGGLVASCLAATSVFEALAEGTTATKSALLAFREPAAIERVAQEAQRTQQYLQSIWRTGRALSAIATLSRTTAASFGITTLDAYMDSLSQIAARIQNNSQTVTEHLGHVLQCRTLTENSVVHFQKSLDAIAGEASAAQTRLFALEGQEREAATTVSRKAEELKAASHEQIKGFVTAIQFSDRVAQRLDHLSGMLAIDDAHIRRLARAQAMSISAAMRTTAEQTRSGMDAIARISRDGSQLFLSGTVAEKIQESLHTRHEAARRVAEGMTSLGGDIRKTRTLIESAMEAYREVESYFNQLERSSKEVSTTAINSVLLVPRGGTAQGALATLSAEVRLTATQCLAAVGGCQAAMNTLVELTTLRQSEVLNRADQLSVSVENLTAEISTSHLRLDELRTLCGQAGDRIEAMLVIVADVNDSMARIVGLADLIDAIAANLDPSPRDDLPPDPALLARIWDTYTMDEERSVHAEVFADFRIGDLSPPVTAGASTDDDFLF